MWRTPPNNQLMVSGNIDVNPLMIEPSNNFPRFNLVVKESMTDMEVLQMINKKGTELLNDLKNNDPADSAFHLDDEAVAHSSCFLTQDGY